MNLIDTTNLEEYRKAGGDSQSSENQQILSKLVENHVGHCVSCLVSDLVKLVGRASHDDLADTAFDQEELWDLCRRKGDPEEAAGQENWYKFSDLEDDTRAEVLRALTKQNEDETDVMEPEFVQCPHGLKKLTDLDTSDADDWQELCDEQRIEVEDDEVYEHWIVDSWYAKKLAEHGETTGDICGLNIYGRCTTGQSMCLDYVTQKIGAEMQILVGQKYDWSKTT